MPVLVFHLTVAVQSRADLTTETMSWYRGLVHGTSPLSTHTMGVVILVSSIAAALGTFILWSPLARDLMSLLCLVVILTLGSILILMSDSSVTTDDLAICYTQTTAPTLAYLSTWPQCYLPALVPHLSTLTSLPAFLLSRIVPKNN